ncbi:MAG: type pilus assembly protein PilC [Thermoleophilaceae bacterium]|jgi:type IV pilus assembly protein PilC|nr:type pilus assembly protein PilC [Thermoleophilaceae bacterium]
MATYAYKAMDMAGVASRGEVDADDKQAVASQLRSRGLIVVDVEEQKPTDVGDIFGRFRRVKAEDLTVASRQLSTMISSGMSMLRALYVLEEQVENAKLRDAFVEVRKDIEAGATLSGSLAKHPGIFNELYVAMVQAGETGGKLEETLKRVADQLEKDDALRRRVKSAMMYPALIISFSIIVVIALVAFLIPVFEDVFKEFGGDLPGITKFTVGVSHFVTGRWYILIGATALSVFTFIKWKKSEAGHKQWDRFKLNFPMKIGEIVHKVALARFSRTFSALVSAGVPMLEAIDITGRTAGNWVIEKGMQDILDSVKRGGTLAAPMVQNPKAFPVMVTQMVSVGEETGALEAMFSKIADFYEDQVDAAIRGLTSLLEPLMIIVVGSIVGFVIISMYLPMFTVYDNIR